MNKTEQGVLKISEGGHSLIHILLLALFCLTNIACADTLPVNSAQHDIDPQQRHIYIIDPTENQQIATIINKLAEDLTRKHPDIIIRKLSSEEKKPAVDNTTDIVIGIGTAGIQFASLRYPETKKLFISTDPEKYRLNPSTNNSDAILYMTQPYCRQIHFIKLIRTDWKTIGLLQSKNNPIDMHNILRCARNYDMKVYTVQNSPSDNLTNDLKNVLEHSDLLLALPDKDLYNARTVKNILLTSYRYRKPIIAFSSNFVLAGALASIHSNTDQIGMSASKLIEHYYENDYQFKKSVNYPDSFNVTLNRQVFKALKLPAPDEDKIKRKLSHTYSDESELKK